MLKYLETTTHAAAVTTPDTDDMVKLKDVDARNRKSFLDTDLSDSTRVVSLQACPGSGKTTTILKLAERNLDKKFIILYYNKSMQLDAEARVKEKKLANITVRTLDSVAFGTYSGSIKKGEPAKGHELDEFFRLKFGNTGARHTWRKFSKSTDPMPVVPDPMPVVPDDDDTASGITHMHDIVTWAVAGVKEGMWWDHAALQKLMHLEDKWCSALERYDVVVLDEAQDIKPAVMAGLSSLHGTKPVFYVGDTDQALYAYDGAVDALQSLQSSFTHKYVLHGTYRFGQQVCDFVNKQGWPSHDMVSLTDRNTAVVSEMPRDSKASYTYLFRSNMAMLEKAAATPNCYFPDLDKKIKQIVSSKLREMEETQQPDMVQIAKYKRKVGELQKSVERMRLKRRRKNQQCVTFSTVHGFKGCEADVVRLGPDILCDDDHRIKLVASTRARHMLVTS